MKSYFMKMGRNLKILTLLKYHDSDDRYDATKQSSGLDLKAGRKMHGINIKSVMK